MKVIIINGSHRTNGITAAALHTIEREFLNSGVESEFYNLSEIQMSHCLGCCSCYRTGHCCIKDDAEKLSELIAEADGIILGSPTYASNVSGLMKDFIDRGHFVIEQLLHGKYCITVATGENYGNKDAAKVLNNLVIYSGGKLCGSIVFKAPFNSVVLAREKINMKCHKLVGNMIKGMRGGKAYPMQNLIHFVVQNIGIKPFVKRKGDLYQGVRNKWKELGISEQKYKIL